MFPPSHSFLALLRGNQQPKIFTLIHKCLYNTVAFKFFNMFCIYIKR